MSWEPAYGTLLFITTVIAYVAGIGIARTTEPRMRSLIKVLAITLLLLILFFFKYVNFFFDSLVPIVQMIHLPFPRPVFDILLPIGISFYIFQAISYIIDVHRGTYHAERHFGIFALYKSFFPQLVAGPIERAANMLPQFHRSVHFDWARLISGLRLMLWGFFKKAVIADNAALIVLATYDNASDVSGVALLIGTIFFAVQVYGDFSGYTDIARGAARIMGYDLMLNFRRPYFARSISDFWNRWHISLTSWFQQYVFMPLFLALRRNALLKGFAPSKQHLIAFSFATLVGLTLLGLWHGAGMHYVLFGLSQALCIIGYHLAKRWYDKLPYFLPNILTLCMVLVGFVFFRAVDTATAFFIFEQIGRDLFTIVTHPTRLGEMLMTAGGQLGVSRITFFATIAAAAFLFLVEGAIEKTGSVRLFTRLPRTLRWATYYVVILIILFLGRFGESPFIYFQF